MEETGRRGIAVVVVVLAGLAYFLVCALPLPKELLLLPVWTRGLSSSPASAPTTATLSPGTEVRPFRTDANFGYFSPAGDILFSAPGPDGLALAKDSYATYDRLSTGFSVKAPNGAELFKVTMAGYPFFAAGRRFVLAPSQSAVTELDSGGAQRWKYEFSSVITAFGASPRLAVFGLMDGTLVGLDPSGKEMLTFASGGSRIPGIYGVAVSPDSRYVAAIAGLDRQRLVVLEKRSSAYRVTWHRWLDSDFRRPVAIAFTEDGKRLMFEAPGGVGVFESDTRNYFLVNSPTADRLGLSIIPRDILVLLTGSPDSKRLVCVAPPDRRLVDLPIQTDRTFIDISGDSIFLAVDDQLLRLDMREE
ncbi:MAG TPA: hypothetical protein VMC79_06505 [Rectinemataceae bacterium]|nr:hypothetical protein [Rectinemataceae bacterium]